MDCQVKPADIVFYLIVCTATVTLLNYFQIPVGHFLLSMPYLTGVVTIVLNIFLMSLLVNTYELNLKGKLILFSFLILFFLTVLALMSFFGPKTNSLPSNERTPIIVFIIVGVSMAAYLPFADFVAFKILKRLQLTYRH